MADPKRIEVERLSDLDDWEYYRVAEVGAEEELCTIGLRPHSEMRQVEYEVWAREDQEEEEEPRLTGSVPCESAGSSWDDATREWLLREAILPQALVGAGPDDVSFQFGREDLADDGEDGARSGP